MVLPCSTFFLSSIVLALVISPSFANFGVKVTEGELESICSKTDFREICLQILKSDPRTASADLHTLAKFTIDRALEYANKTKTIIGSLIANATDAELKARYSECSHLYDLTINNLQFANRFLDKGDISGVGVMGQAASICARDCGHEFDSPPPDPSLLPKRNEELDYFSRIIADIASELLKKIN